MLSYYCTHFGKYEFNKMGSKCEGSALTKTKPCVLIDNPLTKLDRSVYILMTHKL